MTGFAGRTKARSKRRRLFPGPDGLGDALNFDGSFYVQIPNPPDFNLTSNITVRGLGIGGFV